MSENEFKNHLHKAQCNKKNTDVHLYLIIQQLLSKRGTLKATYQMYYSQSTQSDQGVYHPSIYKVFCHST